MSHQFKVGQRVRYLQRSLVRDNGAYEITRLMPAAEDAAPQYRVRSGAGQERAAREHELEPLTEAAAVPAE
ncbi:MAG: hypothetical protein JO048_01240 [Methylobacteriaceae bacterium]|nr:hypothetical protein [Methylobacteriaceae bacterium]